MAAKKKGTIQRIVDTIGNFMRQPMSDESNETPKARAVARAKQVASATRKVKAAKAKGRKGAAKKRATKKR